MVNNYSHVNWLLNSFLNFSQVYTYKFFVDQLVSFSYTFYFNDLNKKFWCTLYSVYEISVSVNHQIEFFKALQVMIHLAYENYSLTQILI